MCCIAGLFDREVKNKSIIKKITDKIIHRGPDESGFYSNQKGFYLGMRRLSIIDLKGGQQPAVNTQTKDCLVFNGEIYGYKNYAKILKEKGIEVINKRLENQGFHFFTNVANITTVPAENYRVPVKKYRKGKNET